MPDSAPYEAGPGPGTKFALGDELPVFRTDFGSVGMKIGTDHYFPSPFFFPYAFFSFFPYYTLLLTHRASLGKVPPSGGPTTRSTKWT